MVDKKISTPKTNGDGQQPSSSGAARHGNAYHKQLAALNCSVRDWIVKHVNTNPLCDLTPIFKDYEKYLASIEQQHGNSGSSNSESEDAQSCPTLSDPMDCSPPGSSVHGIFQPRVITKIKSNILHIYMNVCVYIYICIFHMLALNLSF